MFASRQDGTDGFDLFVKTLADDTPARSLVTLPGNESPTQWPSDTLIVFEQGPNPSDLWFVDLSDPENPRAEEYLPLEADLDDVVVSPDGTLAAYGSNESGRDEIYVRSFPEPGERSLVSQEGGQYPFWSPDGNTLYYWQDAGAGEAFVAAYVQRFPTPVVLSRELLFTGNYLEQFSDLHPAGDRLLIPQSVTIADAEVRAAEPQRLILVQNFFEELRQVVPD